MKIDDPRYYVTYKNRGNDESKDSDIDPNNYTTDAVEIESGEIYKDADGGYFKCGSLIGVYSVIKLGKMHAYGIEYHNLLKGLEVKIYDENGYLVQSVTTNKKGHFRVDNLLPGKYKIVFERPNGLKFMKKESVYIEVKGGKVIKIKKRLLPNL